MQKLRTELVLLVAFLATLGVYCALALLEHPTGRLEDLLIALGGAIAGVTVAHGGGSG